MRPTSIPATLVCGVDDSPHAVDVVAFARVWPSASSYGCSLVHSVHPDGFLAGSLVAMPYDEAKHFWTRSAPPTAPTNVSSNSSDPIDLCSRL